MVEAYGELPGSVSRARRLQRLVASALLMGVAALVARTTAPRALAVASSASLSSVSFNISSSSFNISGFGGLDTAECSELDEMLSCVSDDSDATDDGLTCGTLLDFGLDLACNGTYSVSDDQVSKIESLVNASAYCESISSLVSNCWGSSLSCDVYKTELYIMADEYLGCDLRRRR
jgi:hypothetical protein